jgi:glycosyltransferase involved in cell wall biosynthesis
LLHFQRWLHAQGVPFSTVLARGGALLDSYRALGRVRVLDPRWSTPRVVQAGLGRTGHPGAAGVLQGWRYRARVVGAGRADVVYLNTASSPGISAVRALGEVPMLVSHIHELDVGLVHGLTDGERGFLLSATDRFVAASQAVADNLVQHHGVDVARISVHHEFIDLTAVPDAGRAAELRTSMGIPEDAFVVGASGMIDLRKAPDLFVRLAWELGRRDVAAPVHLIWVGGTLGGPIWGPVAEDLRRLGLEGHVHFTGPTDHPLDAFSLCDLFVLPSREDAFPLACLEAGGLGVPIVCFDTGGMPELVGPSGGGVVVPYPDVGLMADTVAALAADGTRRHAMSTAIREAVAAKHDVALAAPRLLGELFPEAP